ncbi:MAG: hypothetical protein ACTSPY_15170 [Candidatus Helarchaeota archaeon]
MEQEFKDVIPFIVRVLNNMYENVKEIGHSMNQMNKIVDDFSRILTDNVVSISSDLTGIIQIVRASRETIFHKINDSIDELTNEFKEFKLKITDTSKNSDIIFNRLEKAKYDLENKMQDAEFLSLVLELKDLLKKIENNVK